MTLAFGRQSRITTRTMRTARDFGLWLDDLSAAALARPAVAVAWIIGLYFATWTLAQAVFFHAPRRDTVEIMALAPFWPLGMSKHPTLPVWLQEIAFLLTNRAIASTYALSMALMGGTLALLWLFARRATTPQIALIAVALTLANYYFTAPVTQYNHNVPSLFFGAALVLVYREAILDGRMRYWLGVGIAGACLVLTKYSGGFLLVALAVHALLFAKGRASLATPGPYLALALFAILMAPHLVWLSGADGSPIAYAFERRVEDVDLLDRIWIAASFILSQVAFHAGLLVALVLVGLRWSRDATPIVVDNPRVTRFDLSLVLVATLAPMLINALINAVSAVQARPEWGGAYFFFSGLAVLMLLPRRLYLLNPRGGSLLVGILLFVLPFAVVVAPSFTRPTHPVLYPAQDIARAVEQEWRAVAGDAPLRYLIGPGDTATYAIATYFDPIPLVVHGPNPSLGLPFRASELQSAGAVIVWPTGGHPVLPPPFASETLALQGQATP
ncbi:MAG TPA: glycosyltransferase family 39 protein, partial [Saliniramus sp.]|nr:glycosyltransferase family 39 protein [Saliniramus sp.]